MLVRHTAVVFSVSRDECWRGSRCSSRKAIPKRLPELRNRRRIVTSYHPVSSLASSLGNEQRLSQRPAFQSESLERGKYCPSRSELKKKGTYENYCSITSQFKSLYRKAKTYGDNVLVIRPGGEKDPRDRKTNKNIKDITSDRR